MGQRQWPLALRTRLIAELFRDYLSAPAAAAAVAREPRPETILVETIHSGCRT